MLYASSQRLGCFLETLARFRPDPALCLELSEIDGEDDYCPLGTVPREWFITRLLGSATASGRYAEICRTSWIGFLRHKLAVELGEIDVSAVLRSAPRSSTQAMSRAVYDEGLDGIHYPCKYGHDIDNWAIFEPFKIQPGSAWEIDEQNPDFVLAIRLHGLRVAD